MRTNTRAQRAANKRVLQGSTVCHICGHDGADAVDHIVPLARGGSDHVSNKAPAHHDNPCPTCGLKCNRIKGDRPMADVDRRVVLICGPPGAGKTTYAHATGLKVYDLDDEQWSGSDPLFRAALVRLREDPKARAAVIRTGATLSARRQGAANCGATEVVVIPTPLTECIKRIKARGRTEPPISFQVGGARQWWDRYEPGDVPVLPGSHRFQRSGSLSRP